MPERAEVQLTVDFLNQQLKNKYFLYMDFFPNGRYSKNLPENYHLFLEDTADKYINLINSKGKFIYFQIGDWYVFNTLGLAGSWSDKPNQNPCASLIFNYDQLAPFAQTIYFNDHRHFGTLKFTKNHQELANKLNKLGWDPLQEELSDLVINKLYRQFQKSKKTISEDLLDQSKIAGSGNYLRADCLYLTRLHPLTQSHVLSKEQVVQLVQNMKWLVERAYQLQGASISTYRTPTGEKGQNKFLCYGRKTDDENRKIIKIIDKTKRSIHYCPELQKEVK